MEQTSFSSRKSTSFRRLTKISVRWRGHFHSQRKKNFLNSHRSIPVAGSWQSSVDHFSRLLIHTWHINTTYEPDIRRNIWIFLCTVNFQFIKATIMLSKVNLNSNYEMQYIMLSSSTTCSPKNLPEYRRVQEYLHSNDSGKYRQDR